MEADVANLIFTVVYFINNAKTIQSLVQFEIVQFHIFSESALGPTVTLFIY